MLNYHLHMGNFVLLFVVVDILHVSVIGFRALYRPLQTPLCSAKLCGNNDSKRDDC